MRLLEPMGIGRATARNRIVFGPHETNLGRGRAISDRHVAYYQRRAAGGAGMIVVEEASVHASDWPYERCPSAASAGAGWAAVGEACHADGALVVAALGHAGGQGSSAYSQAPLWAPSRMPEVNSREVPKWMEEADIQEVIAAFGAAASAAVAAGLDGVEINAGQHSLVRQFLSGLTNHRGDDWGTHRLRFARAVLETVRIAVGPAIVGLRLSCDELAPWAGIVPDAACSVAAALAAHVDYITVVRGSIFTVSATRPDGHVEPGFNLELACQIRSAVHSSVRIIAQGSIVDIASASSFVDAGIDAVEMTRAQIADPDLAVKSASGTGVRPCLLCNQTCQVRDARNPIVTCVVEPASGYEQAEPWSAAPPDRPRQVLVVGAGVAGLECARVAATRGYQVTVAERSSVVGGMARIAAAGAGRSRLHHAWSWLLSSCEELGVTIETDSEVDPSTVAAFPGEVVLCTGSRTGRPTYQIGGGVVVDAADVLAGGAVDGPVAVWDPIGGPIGISVASLLRSQGYEVCLVTPDLIAGNELSRSGDLAPANVRLLGAGVVLEKRSILRAVRDDGAEVEDRFTGARRVLRVTTVIDAGYRLPEDTLWRETGSVLPRAGDAVAPRSIAEAILEGRRRALELSSRLVLA